MFKKKQRFSDFFFHISIERYANERNNKSLYSRINYIDNLILCSEFQAVYNKRYYLDSGGLYLEYRTQPLTMISRWGIVEISPQPWQINNGLFEAIVT